MIVISGNHFFFAKLRTIEQRSCETRLVNTEISDNVVKLMTGLSKSNFKTARQRRFNIVYILASLLEDGEISTQKFSSNGNLTH